MLENNELYSNLMVTSEMMPGGGIGHIRCLSAVPADLEALLAEIETQNSSQEV